MLFRSITNLVHVVNRFGGNMANFSERIRELRRKNGMTQEALGKIIGVGQDSISIYEKGKHYPEVRNLMILADYF